MKQRELSCCFFRTEGKPAAHGCWCFKREARNLINGLRFLAGIIVVDACWWKRFLCFCTLYWGEIPNYVFMLKRWSKKVFKWLPSWYFFPIHLIHLSLKLLINGIEGMTKAEKLQLFCIKFSEGIMESMPQLMLSFFVILQHGSKDWVEVASIFGSSLSLLYCFSMKYAYLKYSHYPTKKEIFIAGLNNIIPIILFYAGKFVELTILISSQNLGSSLIFVKLVFITIVFYLQFYDIKHHTIKKIAKFFTCSRTVLIFYFVTTVIHTKLCYNSYSY